MSDTATVTLSRYLSLVDENIRLELALRACMYELSPDREADHGEYPELCTACKAYKQARAVLAKVSA